jgi:WYL_2, Sm-like SH3 beta-barrel fold
MREMRRRKMKMRKVTVEYAERLIKSTRGAFFGVSFVKTDGSVRDMVCRLGVTKGIKGTGMAYEPREQGLLPVFDVSKDSYRMINLNTLRRVTVDGQTFAVIQ